MSLCLHAFYTLYTRRHIRWRKHGWKVGGEHTWVDVYSLLFLFPSLSAVIICPHRRWAQSLSASAPLPLNPRIFPCGPSEVTRRAQRKNGSHKSCTGTKCTSSPCPPKLEGTRPTGPIKWLRLCRRLLYVCYTITWKFPVGRAAKPTPYEYFSVFFFLLSGLYASADFNGL